MLKAKAQQKQQRLEKTKMSFKILLIPSR